MKAYVSFFSPRLWSFDSKSSYSEAFPTEESRSPNSQVTALSYIFKLRIIYKLWFLKILSHKILAFIFAFWFLWETKLTWQEITIYLSTTDILTNTGKTLQHHLVSTYKADNSWGNNSTLSTNRNSKWKRKSEIVYLIHTHPSDLKWN